MKNAAITTPPPQMWASRKLGSKPCPPKMPMKRVKLMSTEKHISPWMISSAHSARPPIISASTEEPMTPGAVPRNIEEMFTALPCISSATGVAPETPSTA